MTRQTPPIIQDHFSELLRVYPSFNLSEGNNGVWFVQGSLDFSADYKNEAISDCFEIELSLSLNYPNTPPKAIEVGGRIPMNFHTNKDASLCLGVPLYILIKFKTHPSLLNFINDQVIPFLYSFRYWEINGVMPFGEYSHGGKGIIESYIELFKVNNTIEALALLKVLAENKYRGHLTCPCRSGMMLRKCHGEQLLDIKKFQSYDDFLIEYIHCLLHLKESKQNIPKHLIAERIMKQIRKLLKAELKST